MHEEEDEDEKELEDEEEEDEDEGAELWAAQYWGSDYYI